MQCGFSDLAFSNWVFCIASRILYFLFFPIFILRKKLGDVFAELLRFRKWVDSDVVVEGPPSPATGNSFVCFANSIWVFVICKKKNVLFWLSIQFFLLFFQCMCFHVMFAGSREAFVSPTLWCVDSDSICLYYTYVFFGTMNKLSYALCLGGIAVIM